MNCLHCGDCCVRFSPISEGPCPWLVRIDTFVFCKEYERRPERCRSHKFPFRHCPIGIDILGLESALAISLRIDEGWTRIQALEDEQDATAPSPEGN